MQRKITSSSSQKFD